MTLLELQMAAQEISPVPPTSLGGTGNELLKADPEQIRARLNSLNSTAASYFQKIIYPTQWPHQTVHSAPATIKQTTEEQLYDVLADAKIKTRRLCNHIPSDWQRRLFGQLDRLHDIEDWEKDDLPMRKESYDTFLLFILSCKPSVRPGLGLSHQGDLLGTWGEADNFITLEFMPNSRVYWNIVCTQNGKPDRSSGEASVSALEGYLSPFKPKRWWNRDDQR